MFTRYKIITTKNALMIDILQQKPEMAQGFTKCPNEEATTFWKIMAEELNSFGPSIKNKKAAYYNYIFYWCSSS